MTVKAVIFDLYETLVTQSGTDVPRAGALGASLGLDPTAYRREWKQLRPLALRGELTFQQTLLEVGTRLGVAIPIERVQRACDERIRANTAVFAKADAEVRILHPCVQANGNRSGRLASRSDREVRRVYVLPEQRML